MIPSASDILDHFRAHGGLWRIIPKATKGGQPRPLFAVLGLAGALRTYEGGDLLATVNENEALQGAEWVPVNEKGDRI